MHDGGYCWRVHLPQYLQAYCDTNETPTRSPVRLIEDGKEVGIPHAIHQDIGEQGNGRYSHWHETLYFSATDGSNPNENGRHYSIEFDEGALYQETLTGTGAARISKYLEIPNELMSTLSKREVRRIVYFHTDHFEPWAGKTTDHRLNALGAFSDLTSTNPFAARLSLFYTPLISANLSTGSDIIEFSVGGEVFINAIRALAEMGRHEFHVHIHHEYWTRNDSHFDSELSKAVNERSTANADEQRLDRFIQLSVETIRRDTGQRLAPWGFVHGNWALNASDKNICKIENEIGLLQKHGCFGDFSFPAGRSHCDPTILSSPYTCRPTTGIKAYDTAEADPIVISRGAHAFDSKRFFIWCSKIKADYCSLDYFYEPNLKRFREPYNLLGTWFEQCVVIDGILFIKTHAHSMNQAYEPWGKNPIIPHTHPDVVKLFDILRQICDAARIPLDILTVNEVMAELQAMDSDTANLLSKEGSPAAQSVPQKVAQG